MPVGKLGRQLLRSHGRPERATTWYDETLKGFGVIMRPTAHPSWFIEYRPGGGRGVAKKRKTLDVLKHIGADASPEDIRKLAQIELARVKLGADPAAEHAAKRAEHTVASLSRLYLDDVAKRRKGRTHAAYEQVIRTWIVPKLGDLKVGDVKRRHVRELFEDATEGRGGAPDRHGKPAKGGRTIANRCVAVASAMFGWADRKDLVPENFNPAKKIERNKEAKRKRYLTREEMKRLSGTIDIGMTEGLPFIVDPDNPNSKYAPKNKRIKITNQVAAIIKLLLMTGCRKQEIIRLRWDEVNFEQSILELKDSKNGAKTVILNEPACRILMDLPRIGEHVFPHRNAPETKPMDDIAKPWALIAHHAKLSDVRPHDLRHTVATVAASNGVSLPLIGGLLTHESMISTARYSHLVRDALRQASALVGQHVEAALAGRSASTGEGLT